MLKGELTLILEILDAEGPLGPGDMTRKTSLPRYRTLALFHCLAELGLIDSVYSRGSYKIYNISTAGKRLLSLLRKGSNLVDVIEAGLTLMEESRVSAREVKESTMET